MNARTDPSADGEGLPAARRMSAERRRRLRRTAGLVAVMVGSVLLGSVAYQVFGTAATAKHAQAKLRTEWSQAARLPTCARTGYQASNQRGSAAAVPSAVAPKAGSPLALLRIAKAGVNDVVVEGADSAALRKGPGHIPWTALPGGRGVFAIAGHRTTYDAPFFHLDRLKAGDVIDVTTATRLYSYVVTGTKVVQPEDSAVLHPTSPHPKSKLILLSTCYPRYSAAKRLLVLGVLTKTGTCQPTAA